MLVKHQASHHLAISKCSCIWLCRVPSSSTLTLLDRWCRWRRWRLQLNLHENETQPIHTHMKFLQSTYFCPMKFWGKWFKTATVNDAKCIIMAIHHWTKLLNIGPGSAQSQCQYLCLVELLGRHLWPCIRMMSKYVKYSCSPMCFSLFFWPPSEYMNSATLGDPGRSRWSSTYVPCA